jgi:hypothetical protein
MGKHVEATLKPRDSGPGDPPIPIAPCITEVRETEGVNGAPHSEFQVELTPKERKKGMPPLAPPKTPDLFKPCGTIDYSIWDNEHGDPLPDGMGGVSGGFMPVNRISIERTEWAVKGPIVTCHVEGKNAAYVALDRIVPESSFENISDAAAVEALVNAHAPEIMNLDLSPCGTVFPKLELGGSTLADALNFIAAASGGVWYVDGPTGTLVFHDEDAKPNPVPVSTDDPDDAEETMSSTFVDEDEPSETPDQKEDGHKTPNIDLGTSVIEESKEEIVNKVKVKGGGEPVPHEEQIIPDGKRKEYHLSYPPVEDTLEVALTAGEMAIQVPVFLSRSEKPSGVFYGVYSPKDKNIVFSIPPTGDVLTFRYQYLAPMEFTISNLESIARWGLRERVLSSPTPKHYGQLVILAERIVQDYSEPVMRGKVEVHNGYAYKAGEQVWVHIPELGITRAFLVNRIERDIPIKADPVRHRTTRLYFGAPRVSLDSIVASLSRRVAALESTACARIDIASIETGFGSDRVGEARVGYARAA